MHSRLPTVTPYPSLVAHPTKSDTLERPAKGLSDRLTERSLSRARWSDEAKHVLNEIAK